MVAEGGSDTAESFGEEKAFELRVVEGGRVELHEFQVVGIGSDAVGEGDTVGGSDAGVGGGGVDFAGAAGGEHGGRGGEGAETDVADFGSGSDASAVYR